MKLKTYEQIKTADLLDKVKEYGEKALNLGKEYLGFGDKKEQSPKEETPQATQPVTKDQSAKIEEAKDKVKPKPVKPLSISCGAGTTVLASDPPFMPDGKVNFLINIRGIAGGDTKNVSKTGIQGVVVTCEAGGKGSSENAKAFGSPGFVNSCVSKVISQIKASYPDKAIRVGSVAIASFSGGYQAVGQILASKNQLQYPLNAVHLYDGLHYGKVDKKTGKIKDDNSAIGLKPFVEFAEEAANDPTKQMVVVHTAVPTSYASTTQTANYLLDKLKLQREPVTNNNWNGGIKPVSKATKGGFTVYQLYDKEDPYMVGGQANAKGTSGMQHINANKFSISDGFPMLAAHFEQDANSNVKQEPAKKDETKPSQTPQVAQAPKTDAPAKSTQDQDYVTKQFNEALQDLSKVFG